MCITMEGLIDMASLAQAVVTVCAIILGGIWSYYLFVRKRISYPIIELEFSYHKVELTSDRKLIHAAVKINNVGSVLFKLKEAELRLRTVKPVPSEINFDGDGDSDPVSEGETELQWPLLVARKWESSACIEIEPGESDTLHADYIVSNTLEVVQFYFYLKNKAKNEIGWQLIEFVDLTLEDKKDD